MNYKNLSLNSKRILLIFGNSRAGLAIARSLSALGAEVHNVRISKNKTEIDYSNSITKTIYMGDVFSDFYGVFSSLSQIVNDFDIIVPINDAAYELSFKLKHLAKKSQFAKLPKEKNYRLVSDKFQIHLEFSDLFAPSKIKLNNMFINDINKPSIESDFPIYSKPRVSTSVIGQCLRSFKVKRIKNNTDLNRHVRDSWPVQCLYQPVIENGQSLGINVVAINGKILGIACTRRLHQPKDGGGSSYRISEEVLDEYRNIASEIVQKVDWTGYMMIECIVKDDDIFLIEINPRPYGSLPLTIFSGVDMPKLLYSEEHNTTDIVIAKPHYRARNFAKDLKWLMLNPMSVLGWLFSLRHFLYRKERFDVERLTDILPSITQFQRPFDNLASKLKNKFLFVGLDDNFDPRKPITFVCKGNINRSIVAEKLLAINSNFIVDSCGFICKPGRKISQNGEDFLALHDIDASTHQSKFIGDHSIENSQVVVFERAHVRHVKKFLPDNKVFLLSKIAKNKTFDIRDPESMRSKEANKIFEQINDCVRAIYG